LLKEKGLWAAPDAEGGRPAGNPGTSGVRRVVGCGDKQKSFAVVFGRRPEPLEGKLFVGDFDAASNPAFAGVFDLKGEASNVVSDSAFERVISASLDVPADKGGVEYHTSVCKQVATAERSRTIATAGDFGILGCDSKTWVGDTGRDITQFFKVYGQ
jgi:hypothetical protein